MVAKTFNDLNYECLEGICKNITSLQDYISFSETCKMVRSACLKTRNNSIKKPMCIISITDSCRAREYVIRYLPTTFIRDKDGGSTRQRTIITKRYKEFKKTVFERLRFFRFFKLVLRNRYDPLFLKLVFNVLKDPRIRFFQCRSVEFNICRFGSDIGLFIQHSNEKKMRRCSFVLSDELLSKLTQKQTNDLLGKTESFYINNSNLSPIRHKLNNDNIVSTENPWFIEIDRLNAIDCKGIMAFIVKWMDSKQKSASFDCQEFLDKWNSFVPEIKKMVEKVPGYKYEDRSSVRRKWLVIYNEWDSYKKLTLTSVRSGDYTTYLNLSDIS